MIDNETLEHLSLRVLDLSEAEGAARLEREIASGCHTQYLAEMDDLAAELTLAAPEKPPPARALGRALVEVGRQDRGDVVEVVTPRRSVAWWAGLAAAAALVIAAFFAGRRTTAGAGGERTIADGVAEQSGGGEAVTGGDGSAKSSLPGNAVRDPEARDRNGSVKVTALPGYGARPWRELDGDTRVLREAVAKLRAEREGRFVGAAGLSRTVVVEMGAPGTAAGDAGSAAGAEFSRLVGDAVAAALAGEDTEAVPEPKEETRPADPDPPADTSNPVETRDEASLPDHVERISDGRYWDHEQRALWVRSDQEGVLVDVAVPPGFNYDEIEDWPSIDAIQPGTLPAPRPVEPAAETTPPAAPAPIAAVGPPETEDEAAAAPFAYSIFHETTGEGSVIVSNLPPLTDEKVYQLWLRDSLDGRVLPVGSLPSDLAPTERVDFPPGLLGVSPAGFLLTVEDAGEISQPDGPVVLRGPQPPTSTP